jgi:addiction module HigA family antidote
MARAKTTRTLYAAGDLDYAVPPGETLRELLEEKDMTQRELAERVGLSAKHVNQLIHGLVRLTPDVAESLERVVGTPARIWNRLEADYQSTRARLRGARDLEQHVGWLKELPISELVKRKILPEQTNGYERWRCQRQTLPDTPASRCRRGPPQVPPDAHRDQPEQDRIIEIFELKRWQPRT